MNFNQKAKELITVLITDQLIDADKIIGCSEQEITEVEKELSLELPESYKAFLRHFGKSKELISDLSIFYQDIPELKATALRMLQDSYEVEKEELEDRGKNKEALQVKKLELQQNDYVFCHRFGEQFLFFNAQGKDPKVDYFMEYSQEIIRQDYTFWEFFEGEIKLFLQLKENSKS